MLIFLIEYNMVGKMKNKIKPWKKRVLFYTVIQSVTSIDLIYNGHISE